MGETKNARQLNKIPAPCSTNVSYSVNGDNESDRLMSSGNEQVRA